MNIAIKTPYNLVTEQNNIITLRPRSGALFIIAAVGLVTSAVFYWASRLNFSGDGGIEQFCNWAALIIVPLAGLMFLLGFFQSIKSKVVFDCNSGKMRKGLNTFCFSQIEQLSLERMPFGNREIFFLTAYVNSHP
jgi:hypothetical protein